MIVAKSVSLKTIWAWIWPHVLWLSTASTCIALLYRFQVITLVIPWLPVSVIATAVAFYVGFKNNQSYDRMWEARKIWGGIINSSRTFGMQVDGYITNLFAGKQLTAEALAAIKQRLIYRHIAWLYAHRSQLLIPAPWEHINQKGHVARVANLYQEKFGVGLFADEITQIELKNYLSEDELNPLINAQNTATQIINAQSRMLAELREQGLLDDFRHIELMQTLGELYNLQGRNERIKKFPLPRQYANMSRYFIGIFLLLMPFSLMPEMMKVGGDLGFWVSIPISTIIGLVYVMMELVGDYSENPFQGMANDIPMLSICRTVEIDLKEMLGETDLPKPIASVNDVLM